jgi:hypothetical protein
MSSRREDESSQDGKARTARSITKAGPQEKYLLPVEGEVFLLTSPFIERAYRKLEIHMIA